MSQEAAIVNRMQQQVSLTVKHLGALLPLLGISIASCLLLFSEAAVPITKPLVLALACIPGCWIIIAVCSWVLS